MAELPRPDSLEELARNGNGEDGERAETELTTSSQRCASPEWEMISPTSSSEDDKSSSEESAMQGLSLLDSSFQPSEFLHDDYFAFEPNVPSTSMESLSATVKQQTEIGLLADSEGAENSQTKTSVFTVSLDSNLMEPEENEHEDVSGDVSGTQNGDEDVGTESAEQSSQGLSQVQELSTLQFNPSQSDSNTDWNDMQESDLRPQQTDHEGGELAIVPDPETLGERDNTQDAMELPTSNRRALNSSNRRRRGLLCASWLRRQLALWQAQLRKANTLWSLALAAAVMGILILGRGWRRLQAQNRILRLQLQAKDKKITQLMFQLIQLKEAFSKSTQIPVIRTKPSLQIAQHRM